MLHACGSDDGWELSANEVRVFLDKDWLAATFSASTLTLIGPHMGYTGVHTQDEICAPKLCFKKMCSFVSNCNATVIRVMWLTWGLYGVVLLLGDDVVICSERDWWMGCDSCLVGLPASVCWLAGASVAGRPSGPGSAISVPTSGVPSALWLPAKGNEASGAMAVVAFLAKDREARSGVSVITSGALCVGVCCYGVLSNQKKTSIKADIKWCTM